LLRKFMEDPETFGEAFGTGTLENLCRKLKIWKVHPDYGEMAGHPDTERLFPGHTGTFEGQQKVLKVAKERGYVGYDRFMGVYLTHKGEKLPKVAELMKHVQVKIGEPVEAVI
jgi:hypothetical protein